MRAKEALTLLLIDLSATCVAWMLYFWVRVESGWLSYTTVPEFWVPMIVVGTYWVIVFFLYGLYRPWYAKSRFDEFATVFKAVTFGVLILFFAIFIDDRGIGSPLHSRLLIAIYWGLVLTCTSGGRFLLHTSQRRLLESGIGLHNALVIGWSEKARQLRGQIDRFPALGYRVIGFVSAGPPAPEPGHDEVLGPITELPSLISRHQVKDVLIALDSSDHQNLLRVIEHCNGHPVSIKIVPDLYDIISGQARTNQIYGFPLIEIMPELLTPWERAMKRLIDLSISIVVLLAGLPLWMVIALAIRLDSRGPVFYLQERVGKDGKLFHMIKFRSMYEDAEKHSGPVWANKIDPRITRVGWFLRRARLDEFPQLINVLKGEMSVVGPRPERQYFVDQFSREIPLYLRRLKVRPGITGWAQVRHKYDETMEDVKKKVEYDLYYIENMSLRMDFKILLNTITVMLSGKGH